MREIIEVIFRTGIIYGIMGTLGIEGLIWIIWYGIQIKKGKKE